VHQHHHRCCSCADPTLGATNQAGTSSRCQPAGMAVVLLCQWQVAAVSCTQYTMVCLRWMVRLHCQLACTPVHFMPHPSPLGQGHVGLCEGYCSCHLGDGLGECEVVTGAHRLMCELEVCLSGDQKAVVSSRWARHSGTCCRPPLPPCCQGLTCRAPPGSGVSSSSSSYDSCGCHCCQTAGQQAGAPC
jgi:hypothetical protein